MRRPALIARVAAVLIPLGCPLPSLAASSHQPVIFAARVEAGLLRVVGFELAGRAPRLALGGVGLSIVSASATEIVAAVPASTPSGSHLLTLSLGPGGSDDSKHEEAWVTIGGTGPTGPAGQSGAPGPQGPAGPAGSSLYPSLAGQACVVAGCPGTTAISFDPKSTDLRVSCVKVPGAHSLTIRTTQSAVDTITEINGGDFWFSSDVPGFDGYHLDPLLPSVTTVGGLCEGQRVSVTITRYGGTNRPLVLDGGSCFSKTLPFAVFVPGLPRYTSRATCDFTINGPANLVIQ